MRRRRLLCVELPLATVGYALLAILLTWPIARHLGSTVLGPADSDSAGGIWWLDAIQAKGYRLTGSTTFDQVAYPFGLEQANGLNLQWLIPNFPAYLATKLVGEVAAFNLVVLSGFVLSGDAMYALARRLGASVAVAAWAGATFILLPWHVERAVAGHGTLVHLWCFPLLALSLVHLHARWTRGRVALVGAAVLACWLTSGYFGVMALVIVPTAAFGAAIVTTPRRRALRSALIVSAVALGTSIAVALAAIPGGADGNVGTTRAVSDLSKYGVRPIELVVPSPGSNLMRHLAPNFLEGRRHGSNIQEVSNYLGWVMILLAAGWAVVGIRRRTTLGGEELAVTAGAAATGVAALLLALPSPLTIAGHSFGLMPARLLWEVVPAFRVSSRWSIIVAFAVLVLATLGFEALSRRLRVNGRVVVVGVTAVVCAATFAELRVSHPGVYYSATAAPPEYALLARAPAGPLAEYPFVSSENSTNSTYLLWQRIHRRPILNGAATGTEAEDIRRALVDPADPATAARLAFLGAKLAIIRPDTYARALEQDLPEVPPKLGDGFRRIAATRDGAALWAVVARPAPALAFLRSPEFGLPRSVRGMVVQDLTGPTGAIVVTSHGRFDGVLHVRALPVGTGPRILSIGGRTVTVPAGGVEVTLPLVVSTGRAEVPVRLRGTATGQVGVSLSAPWIERR